uniref:Putative sulfate/bicarbonate/oxalate exchanger sat-1 n=1 Tax=Xenopsylla cheopis TaxID=163159 RepID=A0A6M2DZU5_XENCH
MGPTAIASLLTFQSTKDLGVEYAILLCFLAGVVEVAMGVLGLGFLIDFVSGPVASGFTSAVALIIVTSQVKDVLGIQTTGSTFLDMWQSISKNISDSQMWDCVMGAACIIILLIMRLIAMVKIGPADEDMKTKKQKVVNKVLWLIGTARNAILVVVCGLIGYALTDDNLNTPFKVIGEVPSGLPRVMVPPFSVERNNETIGFMQMTSQLGSGIIVVPLVSLLENIAICKAFANGKSVDATQELLAIGAANIGNSFVQGFPGTGSLSRGAVNNASGARTPLGGLYTGLLVIAALLFFTPYFFFIPKASLGAIIIAAVVFMVEVKVVKPMWRTKKSDLIPGIFTFIACLVFPLEYGILVGIGINVIFILYHAARPKISLETLTSPAGTTYLMLTPDRCLIFPSVDYVRNLVNKQSTKNHQILHPVVIDCSHVYGADFTAATVIKILIEDFRKRQQGLYFYNLKPSVCQTFEALSAEHLVVFYRRECLDDLLKQTESSSEKV